MIVEPTMLSRVPSTVSPHLKVASTQQNPKSTLASTAIAGTERPLVRIAARGAMPRSAREPSIRAAP